MKIKRMRWSDIPVAAEFLREHDSPDYDSEEFLNCHLGIYPAYMVYRKTGELVAICSYCDSDDSASDFKFCAAPGWLKRAFRSMVRKLYHDGIEIITVEFDTMDNLDGHGSEHEQFMWWINLGFRVSLSCSCVYFSVPVPKEA